MAADADGTVPLSLKFLQAQQNLLLTLKLQYKPHVSE